MRVRRGEWQTDVRASRLAWRDLVAEAAAGITQRPGRAVLTMLGTVLGVGAFVAILGLTTSASAQIGKEFDVLTATMITVGTADDTGSGAPGQPDPAPRPGGHGSGAFPADADRRITRLNGAVAAGVWRRIGFTDDPLVAAVPFVRAGSAADQGSAVQIQAASPGIFDAIQATVSHGTLFNEFHDRRGEPVAVLGANAAAHLGITQLDTLPAVFINHRAYTVIGIIGGTRQLPEALSSVIIPRGVADRVYGTPANDRGTMLIRTELGAAKLIAGQAPMALRAERPELFSVVPPRDPRALRENVSSQLTGLFLILAGICLIVGMVGIANTTFAAVLERTGEIGLRRSLGARPRHIAAQFLVESTTLGLIGGLIGTCVAIGTVLSVALLRHWTAVIEPLTVLPAPLIGAATGLIAGAYPALRAARIEPQAALRH